MLELQNITFRVNEEGLEREILHEVSLTVADKQFVVITGPKGGGKSTLAKIIMGMEVPSSGRILLDGNDITGLSVTERANLGIGFAFQQPVRFKGLSVRDLLVLSAHREMSTEDACEFLAQVGLCAAEYIDREVNASLSGGELKRIEIALLMARQTKLALFDEPEAGIDLWSFNNLIRVFERMRDQQNCSVVIISHQERILRIADEVVVIANGRIEQTGTRERVLPGLLGDCGDCGLFEGVI